MGFKLTAYWAYRLLDEARLDKSLFERTAY